ncbi:MAG: IS1 family transposase [Phycisphaerae bacterium]|nr:IS1 family transposase [Phycisphaerae bacterium]
MNGLKTAKRKAVVMSLVEGNSINSTVRMTGVSKPTILKLLADLGAACAKYHDEHVRGLSPRLVQCDEVWSFVYCKDKQVKTAKSPAAGAGDAWTWTALDPESKLIITYHVGLRTSADAFTFMDDLSGRVFNIGQITTDGFAAYPEAVRETFGGDQDYAQVIKDYRESKKYPEQKYSPSTCTGCRKHNVSGFPDPADASTSHVEQHNLAIRMQNRRITRLTNAHRKKIDNHFYALAMFFMYYNYCRRHQTLKGDTPATAAGLADHAWSIEELLGLLD